MKPVLATAALCLALLASAPHAALAENPAQSRQQIEAVIKAFDKAITDKDKDDFMRLFLHGNMTWASVSTDGTLAYYRARQKDPAQQLLPKVMRATPRMFIERIAGDPEPGSEIVENVRIDTDGDIAQVWFDYRFMAGDYPTNWGKEAWQMVRTESG